MLFRSRQRHNFFGLDDLWFYPCIEGFSTLNKLCLCLFLISILRSILYWCSSQVLASLGEFIFVVYYSVIEFVIVLAYFPHESGIRALG